MRLHAKIAAVIDRPHVEDVFEIDEGTFNVRERGDNRAPIAPRKGEIAESVAFYLAKSLASVLR